MTADAQDLQRREEARQQAWDKQRDHILLFREKNSLALVDLYNDLAEHARSFLPETASDPRAPVYRAEEREDMLRVILRRIREEKEGPVRYYHDDVIDLVGEEAVKDFAKVRSLHHSRLMEAAEYQELLKLREQVGKTDPSTNVRPVGAVHA
jgi:hypothetical protein